MSKEQQVTQLTDYMAKFIAHIAKKLPDDVIEKLTELREKGAVSGQHGAAHFCFPICCVLRTRN